MVILITAMIIMLVAAVGMLGGALVSAIIDKII